MLTHVDVSRYFVSFQMLALSRMLARWYDIGAGTNINKGRWTGNWTGLQTNSKAPHEV